MAGPLPQATRQRRNTPTIPTTHLSANGPGLRPPRPPTAVRLGKAGRAWWNWAWRQAQACAWDDGSVFFAARRAQLEDALVVLNDFQLGDIPTDPDELADYLKNVTHVIRHLKALAGGEVTIMREMRELDNRLGLNPKALAELRWTIEGEAPVEADDTPGDEVAKQRDDRRARLAAV